METKFQTSFIPKKPILAQESVRTTSTTSVFMVIATFIFIISIGAAGFTFVAKALLLRSQEQSKVNLADSEKRFNLPLIEELKKANLKIDFAQQLLKNHIAVSEALAMVGGLTAEKIHFSNFEFFAGVPETEATTQSGSSVRASNKNIYRIKMKGIADSYNSVAFQSDVFGRSQKYGKNKALKNPVLSELTVDATGKINFNFAAEIVPGDISYENVLTQTLQEEGAIPPATN